MNTVKEYINSGILEIYVLGLASPEENSEVEQMAAKHPEINIEIDAISKALMAYSGKVSAPLDPTIKPLVMASVDYIERIKAGEKAITPPVLNESSKISDFDQWLNREDLELNDELEDYAAKLIGYQPDAMTAIIWIKDATPYETHKDLHEKFLILEGTCDIVTDEKTISLVPGDYYSIPLNIGHVVKVTSDVPCKAILQRLAA